MNEEEQHKRFYKPTLAIACPLQSAMLDDDNFIIGSDLLLDLHIIFLASLYRVNRLQATRLAKLYLTPYGVGLGHASRMLMIAQQFRSSKLTIRFSSFGEAAEYLLLHGYECTVVPSVEFVWNSEGHFSIGHSIANIPKYFVNFSRQINCEVNNMIEFNPDIVISDTRLSPLLTSKILQIPSIVILNQIRLLLSPRLRDFKVARIFEIINGEVLGLIWTAADKILVPDLPPPYTISENNIWGMNSITRKLEYVGFTSPKVIVDEDQVTKVSHQLRLNRSRPIVFVHVSGPIETRMPLVRIAMDACRTLNRDIQYIISAGYPSGNPEPKKIHERGWYYEWCPVRDEIFSISNLLVLRGGHTVISQAIKFGKPVIAVPIENHGEQLGNSQKIANIGLGVAVIDRPLKPRHLADAIKLILSDPKYEGKARQLMELSKSLDGIDNIVNIIRSYLK
jgi:UDP-N-acetylglucosamine--N-acetylmuramyl-(pentapeptide) pyrophosphoryl-undecaprenol N-acetylglucosamine transferase